MATYTFRQGDLPKLDLQVDRGTDFAAWKAQWDAYATLSGLDKESEENQVKALTLCFSRETLTIVNNLGLPEAQRNQVTPIINAIQQYVDGYINESVERHNFRMRIQQPGEAFDDYLVSLRELAKTCKFCNSDCTDKNVRDQIIEGLHDGDTVQELLQKKDLKLTDAIATCQAQEAAKKNRADISRPNQMRVIKGSRHDQGEDPITVLCPGCGAKQHPGGRKQCPAFRQVCFVCQKSGHFAKVCRSRQEQLTPRREFSNFMTGLFWQSLPYLDVTMFRSGFRRLNNVEQDVANDEDSDQQCEEVSLHMQCIDLIKILFCFAGRRTGCDL